jgi:hypothetical protein
VGTLIRGLSCVYTKKKQKKTEEEEEEKIDDDKKREHWSSPFTSFLLFWSLIRFSFFLCVFEELLL